MKRSELKLTGETYRLTPTSWGDTCIMVDEDAAAEATAEAFGLESCDPDDDPNDKPESVEIATDAEGNYYAVLVPTVVRSSYGKETINENLYRPCQNPAEVDQYGTVCIYGRTWDRFDDEDEQ